MTSADWVTVGIGILAHGPAWIAAIYAWRAHRSVKSGRREAVEAAADAQRAAASSATKVDEIHALVNDRLDRALIKIGQLEQRNRKPGALSDC
jgi:hypothetical protein